MCQMPTDQFFMNTKLKAKNKLSFYVQGSWLLHFPEPCGWMVTVVPDRSANPQVVRVLPGSGV